MESKGFGIRTSSLRQSPVPGGVHSLGALPWGLLPPVVVSTKFLESSNSLATRSCRKMSQPHAARSSEPPQTAPVTAIQALVLHRNTKKEIHRNTKKEIKRLFIEHAAASTHKAEWVIPTPIPSPHPDPDLSPERLSQLSSERHTFPFHASRAQQSKTSSTSLCKPKYFLRSGFAVQAGGISLH